MRNAVVVTLAFLFTIAANAQMKVQPPTRPPISVSGARASAPATFPRISQEDAMKLYKEGKAVFIDVRSNAQFSLGHIKGAFSIPGSQLIKRFGEVPVRKTVITYCACSAEQSSGRAAASLIAHGVKNVFALKGGWDEWKASGYPSATGPK